MTETKKFLLDLCPKGKVEFNDLKNTYSFEDIMKLQKDVYFLASVANPHQRNKDEDIIYKNYFVCDFDLRERYSKQYGTVVSDGLLRDILSVIQDTLEAGGYGDWRYCVFSGNGYHFYWVGVGGEYNYKDYSVFVQHHYNQIDKLFEDEFMRTDHACRNIARIMRIPGSMNYKRKNKYGLDPIECAIVGFQDIKTIKFDSFHDIVCVENEKKVIDSAKYQLSFSMKGVDDPVLDEIMNIDIWELISKIKGLEPQSDRKNICSPRDKQNIGAFVKDNILYNTGTHYFDKRYIGYNPYTFVKVHCGLDNAGTFKWFKDNYPYLEKISKEKKTSVSKEDVSKYFRHITYQEKLMRGYEELKSTNPDNIIKRGRHEWDSVLGGIYGGKIYVIGADTGVGKSTFINQIVNQISNTGVNVVRYSLEDRMEDIAKEELFYECNRIRRLEHKEFYVRPKFCNNEYGDAEFDFYLKKAYDNLSGRYIIELDKEKGVDIDSFIILMEEQAQKGCRVFVIDHLHYFDFSAGTKAERLDLQIKNVMHKINEIARKYNVAVFLVAHYRNVSIHEKGGKPDYNWFRDGSSIKQVANVIIQIQRDFDDPDNVSEFHITKLRGPIKPQTIETTFNLSTYEYNFKVTEEQKRKEKNNFGF